MDTNNGKNLRGSSKLILIIVAIVIIFIIGIIIFFARKSDGQKFLELMTKDQYVVQMFEERKEEFSKDGETNYTIVGKNGLFELLNLQILNLLGGNVKLETNVITEGKKIDTNLVLKIGDTEIQSLELIKEKDRVAIAAPQLFDDYAVVQNKNLESVARRLGYISGDAKEDNDMLKDFKKIYKKYSLTLAKSIDSYVTKTDEVETEVNGTKVVAKRYELKLGTKAINTIYSDILKKLKDDDDTIAFIFENTKGADIFEEDMTEEKLKEEIKKLYEEKSKEISELTDEDQESITVCLYESNKKNIKTIFNVTSGGTPYELVLETFKDENNDYVSVNLDIVSANINIEYIGKKAENSQYTSEVKISSGTTSLSLATLDITKVENSEAKVKKIDDLKALYLDEATDEELENWKKQMYEKDENTTKQDTNYEKETEKTYEDGEFKLKNPDLQVNVLENAKQAYDKVNPLMTREDVIEIFGEPDDEKSDGITEYLYWYQGENIPSISVGIRQNKVYDVYKDIASSMDKNVQISKELDTQIEDLNSVITNVKINMDENEVVEILGDKFVETNKNILNYKTLKWYDKEENSVKIDFDKEGKVWHINDVKADK